MALALGSQLGCGGPAGTAARTHVPVGASATASVPSATATPPIAAADFSCRIRVSGFTFAPGALAGGCS